MIIRRMDEADLSDVAKVHESGFPRHLSCLEWVSCNFKAFPRMQCFVAELEKKIAGYIQWSQRAGFRKNVVLELEHLAVLPEFRGKGIGHALINDSLREVEIHLKERDAEIKHIVVTTRADNDAQKLYKSTLAAKVEFTIPDLYSADEVYMIARNYGEHDRVK